MTNFSAGRPEIEPDGQPHQQGGKNFSRTLFPASRTAFSCCRTTKTSAGRLPQLAGRAKLQQDDEKTYSDAFGGDIRNCLNFNSF
jgi:hypothetical protein